MYRGGERGREVPAATRHNGSPYGASVALTFIERLLEVGVIGALPSSSFNVAVTVSVCDPPQKCARKSHS